MKRQVTIIGAGISGLTAAWTLRKRYGNSIDIKIFEKSHRAGGWIRSETKEGFFFEKGPRTLRAKGATLELVKELGLEKEILWSNPLAKRRYIQWNGKLEPLPQSLKSFITSPLTKGIKWDLLKGLLRPGTKSDDLSIAHFVKKRFSKEILDRFFAPMVLGIYAGDTEQLSLKHCFPSLYEAHTSKAPFIWNFLSSESVGLFTVRGGLERIIDALVKEVGDCIEYGVEAKGIDGAIYTGKREDIPYKSVTVVQMGWKKELDKEKGFGYLVPPLLKRNLLGVVFDSDIFPEENTHEKETRITALFHTPPQNPLVDLQIDTPPDFYSMETAHEAIAQYPVGMQLIKDSPYQYLGTSTSGVGISDVVRAAKKVI